MSLDVATRARELYLTGKEDLAIQMLNRALGNAPEDGAAWELRGVICHGRKDLKAALHALETATSLKPLTLGGELALADCYARLDFKETAHAIYSHLADGDKLKPQYVPDVVVGLSGLGDNRRALRLCREAAERDPLCDQATYGMAYYMAKCGYPGEVVLPVLQKAVQLAPEVVQYQVSLANLYDEIGQREQGLGVMSRLDVKQLQSIGCANCLCKFADWFEVAGDSNRRDACLSRMKELKSE